MKTYNNLYDYLCSLSNLTIAWRKARKDKTLNDNIIDFESKLEKNFLDLHFELKSKKYKPKPLTTFVLRDPKTRVISKSDFRDRVVHHALINVIGPIFAKKFIYDSCANQINKGTTFALKRFRYFLKKLCRYRIKGFCLKADIKHYFDEIDHENLIQIISRIVKDENVIWLLKQILNNNRDAAVGGGGANDLKVCL